MFKNEYELAQLIDHSILKADVLSSDVIEVCKECIKYDFKMIAINQVHTQLCYKELIDSEVSVGAAIAFPLGQTSIEAKCAETELAITDGADEIDYVLNIGKLREKDYDYIKKEMQSIVEICNKANVISKVIFENCYLEDQDIIAAAKIAKEVGPTFVKTSTGFGVSGAKVEDIKLMREHVGDQVKIKAAGGIRDLETLEKMVKSGASRIGTSSGIKIIKEYQKAKKS